MCIDSHCHAEGGYSQACFCGTTLISASGWFSVQAQGLWRMLQGKPKDEAAARTKAEREAQEDAQVCPAVIHPRCKALRIFPC